MALESMTAVVTGAKHVYELAKTVSDAGIKIELQSAILDVQQKAMELQDENSRLKEEIRQLKYTKEFEKRIIRHDKVYITLKDDEKNIKYCAICYGERGKFIQLWLTRNGLEIWCSICNQARSQ